MASNLFVYTAKGQSFEEAYKLFATTLPEQGAVALLYTPDACLLARLNRDGSLVGSTGQPVDTSLVYEARVFHENAELRWWNDPSAQRAHRTTILCESVPENWASAGIQAALFARPIIGTLRQQYMLWGTGMARPEGLASGWSALATPRIGRLDVPIPSVQPQDRVIFHAVEYLSEYDDGNVGVAEERLQRMEICHA